jgi:phosphomevalonate kinase
MTVAAVASAPGKVVLSGEYAVLDGAPAIAMAIDRRASVRLTPIAGDVSVVTAAAFTDVTGHFHNSGAGIVWQDGEDAFSIVNAVLRAADRIPRNAISLQLDTSEFMQVESRQKLGIGSSAALAVALSSAMKGTTDVAAMARRAHAELQGEAGSGVDVACSLHGGLIEYRMEGCSVRRLQWPDDLVYRLVWTGVAASTPDKLRKLGGGISKPSRVRLAGASEAIAMAWAGGDAPRLLEQYRTYTESLFRFSVDHDLGIFDAGHEDLWRAAAISGLVYKPCGAGGGDVGILLGTSEEALAAYLATLPEKYTILDCKLSASGVTYDGSMAERP